MEELSHFKSVTKALQEELCFQQAQWLQQPLLNFLLLSVKGTLVFFMARFRVHGLTCLHDPDRNLFFFLEKEIFMAEYIVNFCLCWTIPI